MTLRASEIAAAALGTNWVEPSGLPSAGIALAALGWTSEVHRIPNPADPTHLAAIELRPHRPSDEDIALAAAIPQRRTDRRRFSSWPVPPGHLDLMMHRASRAGALLVPVTDAGYRHHLVRAITEAADRQDASPEYSAELAIWAGRSHATADGVLAASAPPRPRSHGDTRMRTFPHGTLTESTADGHEDDAGELLVLASPDDDPRSRLRAGEATSAVLLTATDLNLANCPLFQALEITDTPGRDPGPDPRRRGRAAADPAGRLGPHRRRPSAQSPRRPLEDVIGFLPGLAPRDKGR